MDGTELNGPEGFSKWPPAHPPEISGWSIAQRRRSGAPSVTHIKAILSKCGAIRRKRAEVVALADALIASLESGQHGTVPPQAIATALHLRDAARHALVLHDVLYDSLVNRFLRSKPNKLAGRHG